MVDVDEAWFRLNHGYLHIFFPEFHFDSTNFHISHADPPSRLTVPRSPDEVQQAAHSDVEDGEVEESGYQPAWKRKNLQKELEEIDAIEATAIAIRQGEWEWGVGRRVWMRVWMLGDR